MARLPRRAEDPQPVEAHRPPPQAQSELSVPVAYDYVVTVRATPKTVGSGAIGAGAAGAAAAETYRHPVQAYNIQDAMMSALIELEAEHGFGDKMDMRVLSVRPDPARLAAETTRIIEQMQRRT
jgi:hypothetical protein